MINVNRAFWYAEANKYNRMAHTGAEVNTKTRLIHAAYCVLQGKNRDTLRTEAGRHDSWKTWIRDTYGRKIA